MESLEELEGYILGFVLMLCISWFVTVLILVCND